MGYRRHAKAVVVTEIGHLESGLAGTMWLGRLGAHVPVADVHVTAFICILSILDVLQVGTTVRGPMNSYGHGLGYLHAYRYCDELVF